jgi:membrane-bound serine protease (ClpP class)
MYSPPTRPAGRSITRLLPWCWASMFAAVIVAMPAVPTKAVAQRAIVLEIADYVVGELRTLSRSETGLIVLRMNTPGGLDTSMRDIISAMLASPVPVATYVAPNGARAASAGTYIAYASAVVGMAPGTNIGAATPVQLGVSPFMPGGKPEQPSGQKDGQARKALNDAVAYIRSLAELNGRNAEWAAEAVRSAASLQASEALKLHVIDVIADDVPELLRKIDGRAATVAGKPERLATAGLQIVTVPPNWRTKLLAIATNPNVALILMLIGIYGPLFEFLNPGAVVPGLIGAISLLVALYALHLLPVNYSGAALLLLGVGLMIAEAHIGAFGVIGVGGIIAFVIGAIMMFPPGAPGFQLSPAVAAGAVIVSASLFLLVLSMLFRSRKRLVVTGKEALLGAEGEALDWRGEDGRVRIKGEIWRARAAKTLPPGTRVKVVDRDGLVLVVESA